MSVPAQRCCCLVKVNIRYARHRRTLPILLVCFIAGCCIRAGLSQQLPALVRSGRSGPRIGRSLQGIITQQHEDTPIHIIVGYKQDTLPDPDSIQAHSLKRGHGLKRVNAAGAVVTKEQLQILLSDPNISYIEEDAFVYPATIRETIPWGVHATQGDDPGISRQYTSTTGANRNTCNDGTSIKLALIDSGVDWDHPDLPCISLNETNTNCIGKQFELENTTEQWFDPSDPHGTHVFGTIAGSTTNGVGVSGMLTDIDNVCFIICQIFSKSRNARASTVIEAAQWAIEQGATVINMSLSGTVYVYTAEQFFASTHSSGVISIAASGNDGTDELNYPAAYPTVIAVGAVAADLSLARYSNFNDQVDLAAPGSDILSSTLVGEGKLAKLSLPDKDYMGIFMRYASRPEGNVTGEIVVCSDYGMNVCEGNGGHICVIQRGEVAFDEKARNCEAGGGVAAVIYNTEAAVLDGALIQSTETTIPVFGMSMSDGDELAASYNGVVASLGIERNYAYMSGTSMAAPHVAGAIVETWRQCRNCTNREVEECLFDSALDLGSTGKDPEFGYGLLQTRDAYQCLANTIGCCQ